MPVPFSQRWEKGTGDAGSWLVSESEQVANLFDLMFLIREDTL